MLFNTVPYWFFFATVLVGYFALPVTAARVFLVVASLGFYCGFGPALVLLIIGSTAFNFATGLLIGRSPGRAGGVVLAVAVAANLALLATFKYYAFVVSNLSGFLDIPPEWRALRIVLPVAISFYTFEAIAYNVDVRRGAVAPRRNFLDFALFMTFFPRLVAGPIIRPADFFPQLRTRRIPSGEDIRWGVLQIVKGLLKKAIFADGFAVVADAYFTDGAGAGSVTAAWIGVLAFAFQIYFDFAGYTDIARGCARLLGFSLPPNFERPYLAPNIAEFWRRWHISLSSWLRDYLYIPLGGSRRGGVRTGLNLMITMTLGGFWHGASWNFLIWGALHGSFLLLHRAWRTARGGRASGGTAARLGGTALTFVLVGLAWVPFRAPDLATTWRVVRDLFGGTFGWPAAPASFYVLACLAAGWCALDPGRRLQDALSRGETVFGGVRAAVALALALMALALFSTRDLAIPFIYFQF